MQTLTFMNLNLSQYVSFPSETANGKVYLQNVEGITGLKNIIQSHTAPDIDGAIYDTSTLGTRNITLKGVIFSDTYDELNALKRTIINTFNPKHESELIYSNTTYTKKINVRIENTVVFSSTEKNKYYQEFFVSLIALEPFWEDEDFSYEIMSLRTGGFFFDLEFADDVEFEVESGTYTTIENEGDVPAPVTAYFYGPCTNPKLINDTTGEYILVNETLLEDEYLIINTKKGSKSVTKVSGGVSTNAFGSLDLSSTFFELILGENVLSYDADSGMEDAYVRIVYKNLFLGL